MTVVHTMLVVGRWPWLIGGHVIMWVCYMSWSVHHKLSFAGCSGMNACNGVAVSVAGTVAVTSVVPVVVAVVGQQQPQWQQ
jgi:hypothetical protein